MVRKEESKTESRTEFQPKAGIGNAAIKENMESEKNKKEISFLYNVNIQDMVVL